MRRLLLLCVAAAVLAAPLAARRAGTWSYGASDHFEVFISGNEKSARAALTAFEGFSSFFESFLRVTPGWRPKTRLVIFANAKEYELYRPRTNVEAYWLGTPDGDFIVLQAFDDLAPIDAVHELTHLMIARTGASYPLWVNEGLAQFYSTMRPSGAKVRLGLELPDDMDTLRKNGDPMAIDRLFSVDRELPAGTTPALEAQFYAVSWGLAHMLMTQDAYRDRAQTLLAVIAGGATSADAFSKTYGKPAAAVNADLRKYLSRFKVDSMLVDAPPAPASPQIKTSAADDLDAAVTLGSVLGWQQGREDDGRAVLEALEKDSPNRLRLVEARALLEYYTRHCEPARQYLEKAVGLGSANPTVLRAAANIMAPTDPERSRTMLAKASAASPAPMTASKPTIVMTPCAGW